MELRGRLDMSTSVRKQHPSCFRRVPEFTRRLFLLLTKRRPTTTAPRKNSSEEETNNSYSIGTGTGNSDGSNKGDGNRWHVAINLPEDILMDIFLRLPRRSLRRLRFSSTAWLRRISDPSVTFYFHHLSLNRPMLPFFRCCPLSCHDSPVNLASPSYWPFINKCKGGANVGIIASTGDGLLLASRCFAIIRLKRLLVWNPRTDQWTVIPPPPPPPFHVWNFGQPMGIGIGIVSTGKATSPSFHFQFHFQVILVSRQEGILTQVCTFSSELGQWTTTLATTEEDSSSSTGNKYTAITATAVDGILYWPQGVGKHLRLQAYDVGKSHFSTIRLPRLPVRGAKLFWCLDKSTEGRLRYTALVSSPFDYEMVMWTLEKDRSSWRLERRTTIGGMREDVEPFGLDDEVLLWAGSESRGVYAYDSSRKVLKEIGRMDKWFARIYPYQFATANKLSQVIKPPEIN